MNFPSKIVENAVEQLSRLPGIGKRSALRLVLHMLKQEKTVFVDFLSPFEKICSAFKYKKLLYTQNFYTVATYFF